jgi:hypothetical protein
VWLPIARELYVPKNPPPKFGSVAIDRYIVPVGTVAATTPESVNPVAASAVKLNEMSVGFPAVLGDLT